MTEEEAKEKWCPMVRIEEEAGSFNRTWSNLKKWFSLKDGVDQDKICNCIASDCMMWREALTRKEASQGYKAESGYCGLVGKE